MFSRLSPSLRRRILFLIVANSFLLGFVYQYTARTANASFASELTRSFNNVAPNVLAGIALTGIIYTGAIDLSIGAILVVAGTVFGILYEHGASPGLCFVACCLTAAALSVLNGYLIRLLKIPAIIVTLAGLTFYRGLALLLAAAFIPDYGGQISIVDQAYKSPGKIYAGWVLAVALVAAILWEAFGKTPRTWLAHGCSQVACRLGGLRPGRVLQSSFVAGGVFLGLAALLDVTNRSAIEPARMARGFELDVIGGVVLGGTNIFGGEGSFVGTALGMFFLYWVGQALLYANVSEYWRTAIQGAMIVVVIGFDCAMHRKQKQLDELR